MSMKPLAAIALLCTPALLAQQPSTPDDTHASSITMRSNLVVVPALVKTRSGELVFTLKADDFTLTDDGIPQKLRLDEDAGSQPLALVLCVETGGDGAAHLADYANLGVLLDNLIGSVDHKIALVGFDSTPVLLHGFTPNTEFIQNSLNALDPGDNQAAILDGLTFSVNLLRSQPTTYRRAVLLLSETIDQGSHTKLVDALRAISDTNTMIYSVGFGSTRLQVKDEASKLSSAEPGPTRGCFSRDFGTDADGNPIAPPTSAGTQTFDCFAELAPPLRLAKMAEIILRNALRKNTAESVARLTGGEFYKFHDGKTLDKDLFTLSNHVPNRYTLSFVPTSPTPGFHAIGLTLKDHINLKVEARNGYWIEPDPK
jgi:VWFA-related protein